MFPSWPSASTSFRIGEVHGRDHRKPLFLPLHGLDAEKVKEQMCIHTHVPEQSQFEIMLNQSKVPMELTFFFMVEIFERTGFYTAKDNVSQKCSSLSLPFSPLGCYAPCPSFTIFGILMATFQSLQSTVRYLLNIILRL
ncbi:hypothetical protein TNIN_213861 [Trichonephila inaurata madagascariensis]|uniref:Uncharacterized protein n=1 Tax=Trichonephila inaurata madagascariensis TaxID=2747483 RepID=A0A8X7CPS3_9ARAC|nr:hypothetical protein TNIN_213861 [Trichonephila inaurata madagascariensis]